MSTVSSDVAKQPKLTISVYRFIVEILRLIFIYRLTFVKIRDLTKLRISIS